MIVAVVEALTDVVVATKVALVAPAATVTLLGIETVLLLDVSATTAPPIGAGAVIVMVPVEVKRPPTPEVGLRVNVLRVFPLTVTDTLLVTPPAMAVTLTVWFEPTS